MERNIELKVGISPLIIDFLQLLWLWIPGAGIIIVAVVAKGDSPVDFWGKLLFGCNMLVLPLVMFLSNNLFFLVDD